MTATTTLPADDPLNVYPNGAMNRHTQRPVPLTQTRFAVTLRDGVARVETWRSLRNAEDHSIEVTMTFPMPVRAVMYALELDNGGRKIEAAAVAPDAARAIYEDQGVNEGRLAVLHEEKLPGIHMVSVVHIPPGATITVRSAWAAFLAPDATGRSSLRIPMTVGDIYGRSPLIDSDDLLSGGPAMSASLTLDAIGAEVRSGGALLELPARIPLDRPLDIVAPTPAGSRLSAKMRDGRRVTLSIAPFAAQDIAIDAAVLIDRSGSMDSPCYAAPHSVTKHAAVRIGLAEAASSLTGADRIRLFDFNDVCRPIAETMGAAGFAAALSGLGDAMGGTEIGVALTKVLATTPARDIVLITDGKSYALDIATLLRSGRRFTVVLIGDDSLEARVGHLAASSGGALVVARGAAVAEAVSTAFATLRAAHEIAAPIEGPLARLGARQDGLEIGADWDSGETVEGPVSDAVRALAAALALPRLSEDRARDLATAEGLVGRYSSLVLVDPEAERQTGFPYTYKFRNAAPASLARPQASAETFYAEVESPEAMPSRVRTAAPAPAPPPSEPAPATPGSRGRRHFAMPDFGLPEWLRLPAKPGPTSTSPAPRAKPSPAWPRLDDATWSAHADALARCALAELPPGIASRLSASAADGLVIERAKAAGIAPLALVIALLATRETSSRAAGRVAGALLRGRTQASIDELLEAFAASLPPAPIAAGR